MRVAVVGDLAVDLAAFTDSPIARGSNTILGELETREGGVAGNISCALAQLGFKVTVHSCVGKDPWGKLLIRGLRRAGVSTGRVQTSGLATSFFLILVASDGERTMIGSKGANAELKVSRRGLGASSPAWIHVSGFAMLGKQGADVFKEARAAARETGARLSTDLEGVAYSRMRLDLEGCVVFANMDEFEHYFKKQMGDVDTGGATVVVKAGGDGCYLIEDEQVTRFPAVKARVKDTTGAGDAFDAGFIAAVLRGNDSEEACKWGNRVASVKVRQTGSRVRLETPGE